jgi:hypothetical protein
MRGLDLRHGINKASQKETAYVLPMWRNEGPATGVLLVVLQRSTEAF